MIGGMMVDELETFNSAQYWQRQYRQGGTSGAGSYGQLADYKASYINNIVDKYHIQDVIEFGCGDGNQASLFDFPRYTGIDVSKLVVRACRQKFADRPDWRFFPTGRPKIAPHDMAMSLDVIYHLIEDHIYDAYMHDLFANAKRFVLIYASDKDEPTKNKHVRHRLFSNWVSREQPDWQLLDCPAHPFALVEGKSDKLHSFASFKLYATGVWK